MYAHGQSHEAPVLNSVLTLVRVIQAMAAMDTMATTEVLDNDVVCIGACLALASPAICMCLETLFLGDLGLPFEPDYGMYGGYGYYGGA